MIAKKNILNNFGFQWLVVLSLCILVRLPYFLGAHFFFDGDEAIIGIMAQDLLKGENIPIYFYGQQYGFSFFEVLSTAIFIFFFGSNVLALKLGALVIFSFGCTFLFRLILKKTESLWWSLISILLIVQFPAWIMWACKDRGGYVTAFAITCMVLYIVQLKPCNFKYLLISSGLVALMVHSQLLIAMGPVLLFARWVIQTKRTQSILLSIILLITFYFLIKLPAYQNINYWPAPQVGQWQWNHLYIMIKELPTVALGYFYYELTFPIKLSVKITGFIYFIILFIAGFIIFFKANKKVKISISLLFFGGIVSFIILAALRFISYRYFLGILTAMLLIMVLLIIEGILHRKQFKIFLLVLLPLSFILTINSKEISDTWMMPEGNDQKLYQQLTHELDKRGAQYIFCTDPLLQWMLNYSGYNARFTSNQDRVQRFVDRVNNCYADPGCKAFIVGFKGNCNGMDYVEGWHQKVFYVNDKYYIFEDPDRAYLLRGGFE